MRARVFVTRRFDPEGLRPIWDCCDVNYNDQDAPLPYEDLLEGVAEADALICTVTDRVDMEVIAAGGRLRVISTVSVGYDHIDLEGATRRRILVTNTPDVLTETTADLTWALILATARRIAEGDRRVRQGLFREWSFLGFLGTDVYGKVLGIIGMGRIGMAVARRAVGFDMRILYEKRSPLPKGMEEALKATFVEREALLATSDFITLHVPLTEETRHMISDREFRLMRPTAILINTSRGPVVDEEALCRALEAGRIAGAGLDVYEREPEVAPALLKLPQVVLTPHVGSATVETRRRMTQRAVLNCLDALEGRRPPDLLNPEVLASDPSS